ncbi:MAG: SoxR reducing system RseC family protein [Clostridiales bacterium]|nr:SoxR reducing system RseC family protein [Clostridiales bacterium]
MESIGEVISIDGKIATVKFKRAAMCKNCKACVSFSPNELVVELENSLDAKVGDRVAIVLHTRSIVKASLIMYGIPLIALLLGMGFGSLLGDLFAAIIGISAALISYLALHFLEPVFASKQEFNPKMLAIIVCDD